MQDTAPPLSDLSLYFGNILEVVIPLIGLLAFVMILVGGFKILTSAGDPKGLEAGKTTVTLAITGIVLAILSWLILVFIKNATGVNVTEFKLGF